MGFVVVVVLFHHWSILWEFLHNQSYYLRTEVKMKVKAAQSCLTLCNPMDYYNPWNSPGQNTRVGSLSLLQGIFPAQGQKPSLPPCSQILYQLSHKGSLRILEWVAYPFSSGSSWPWNHTRVSCIAGGFFTNWAIREPHFYASFLVYSPIHIYSWYLPIQISKKKKCSIYMHASMHASSVMFDSLRPYGL